MKLLRKPITKGELRRIAMKNFGGLVKAVVDISKKIMVIDADLHADQEAFLLTRGSKQNDLWGINLYPDLSEEQFIEFDSMINLRPNAGNLTRGIDDDKIKAVIGRIVARLIK